MLRGAAPVNGRAARSTAARMETMSAKEPGSSRAESNAGIGPTLSALRVASQTPSLSLQALYELHDSLKATLLATLRTPVQPNNHDDERPPKNSSLRTVSVILWTSLSGEGPW